jgi:hypothetical protein
METMKKHRSNTPYLLMFLALVSACSAGGNEAKPREPVSSAQQWVGLEGEDDKGTVWEENFVACGKWESTDAYGATVVSAETYNFERMNDELAADANLVDEMASRGFAEISSCTSAREMRMARVDIPESSPQDDPNSRAAWPTEPEEAVDKIADGYAWSHWPTVQLFVWYGPGYAYCATGSGLLIGNEEIVSAAHGFLTTGIRSVSVKNWDGTCLHGDCSNGGCAVKPAPTGTAYAQSSYSGTGDWGDDIAVIKTYNPHPSPANTSSTWIRVVAERFPWGGFFWMSGWGVNSHAGTGGGVLRASNAFLDNEGNFTAFTTHAVVTGEGRMCEGDSGGGAISATTYGNGAEAVAAVASGTSGSGSAYCPYPGAVMYHAQTWRHISWLESKIGACTHYAGGYLDYVRCW